MQLNEVQFSLLFSCAAKLVSEKRFAALKAVGNLTDKSFFPYQDPDSISTIHFPGNPVDTASSHPLNPKWSIHSVQHAGLTGCLQSD